MALEKLMGCNCLHKPEKDMILESLQVNLRVIDDLFRNQTTKFTPDTELVKHLKSQKIFIEDLNAKVGNTPTCKP